MAEQTNKPQPDEVDLGQILKAFQTFSKKLGRGFLMMYGFFIKNLFILVALVVIGVGLGALSNYIVGVDYQKEVIVRPNVDSEGYLIDKINEISRNIESEDSIYFSELGIPLDELVIEGVELEPMGVRPKKAEFEQEMMFFELLERFKDQGYISELVKSEITKKSSLDQRIVFTVGGTFSEAELQTQRILDVINDNEYYNELVDIFNRNAETRIETNSRLVEQIDQIIAGYTNQLSEKKSLEAGQVVLDQEEKLDITGLLALKNRIIEDTEGKLVELERRDAPVSIIYNGKIKKRKRPLFESNYFIGPAFLLGLFFLWHILKYLNKEHSRLIKE
jgi:hypothetical protein